MNDTRTDRVLHDWDAVASRAVRPAYAPRRSSIRSRAGGGLGLLPLAGAALAVALAVTWLGGHEDRGAGDPGPSRSPAASTSTALASPPSSSPSSSPAATEPASTPPAPTPSVEPSTAPAAPCDPDRLAVAITSWDGAAGSRTATLTLRLAGAEPCTIDRIWRPELVDASGRIRIEGGVVRDTGPLELRAGETLTTLAQASNDCAPPPVAPVTIAFVLDDGSRVVAEPASQDDVTTPPCNGPGQPGTISMQAWTR